MRGFVWEERVYLSQIRQVHIYTDISGATSNPGARQPGDAGEESGGSPEGGT